MIEAFVQLADAQCGNTVRSYLKGETGIDALYALGDKLTLTGSRWGGKHWNILKSYQEGCGQDALGSRCEAFLMAVRVPVHGPLEGAALQFRPGHFPEVPEG